MANGKGINTVEINGEVIHITDLDSSTLCDHWSKRQRELRDLYDVNTKANAGWRGVILKLIGVNLPDRNTIYLGGVGTNNQSLYSHEIQFSKTSEDMSEGRNNT